MRSTGARGTTPWRILRPFLPAFYGIFPPTRNLKRYKDTLGRVPNVIRPRRFTEHIQRKILFDRNPMMEVFADKLLAREFAKSRLGDAICIPKTYAIVESPVEIESLNLPSRFVMKPNHASGLHKIVTDSSSVTHRELENLAAEWLKVNFYDEFQEWAYKRIRRRVFFDELLEVEGEIPMDYKFYCFHGEPRFLYVTRERRVKIKMNFYDLNFNLLPVKMEPYDNFNEELRPPTNFDAMIRAARRLSAGIDFVRVDLYSFDGRVVFGELTNYPTNGRGRFVPPEWDFKFGSFWERR